MRIQLAVLLAMLSSGAAFAEPFDGHDTVLADSASVPVRDTTRALAGGGGQIVGGESASSALVSVLYVPVRAVGLSAGGYVENQKVGPTVSLRWQLLSQETAPLNLAGLVRYKSEGFFEEHGEIEASLNLGRRFGGLDLLANFVVGRELSQAEGMDGELKLSGGWQIADRWRVGADARVRNELQKGEEAAAATAPVEKGREYEALAGPTIACRLGDARIQALAGVYAPKGSNDVGSAAFGTISFDF